MSLKKKIAPVLASLAFSVIPAITLASVVTVVTSAPVLAQANAPAGGASIREKATEGFAKAGGTVVDKQSQTDGIGFAVIIIGSIALFAIGAGLARAGAGGGMGQLFGSILAIVVAVFGTGYAMVKIFG
jgi:hypothetical protein